MGLGVAAGCGAAVLTQPARANNVPQSSMMVMACFITVGKLPCGRLRIEERHAVCQDPSIPNLKLSVKHWVRGEYNAKLLVTFSPTLPLATCDNPAAGNGARSVSSALSLPYSFALYPVQVWPCYFYAANDTECLFTFLDSKCPTNLFFCLFPFFEVAKCCCARSK